MPSAAEQAQAQIAAQARLREIVVQAITGAWTSLPNYDAPIIETWLARVVPLMLAAQRQSVALTDAYLARALDRPPLGVDAEAIIRDIRGATTPQETYRRPFVNVWTDLKAHRPYEDAVRSGLDRATSSAEMDVQLAQTHALRAIGEQDNLILGYARVPDPGACEFCKLIAGQRYRTDQLAPVHNRCGCSVAPITAANRHEYTGKPENDLSVPGAEVYEHGEYGPVVGDPNHRHLTEAEALAR